MITGKELTDNLITSVLEGTESLVLKCEYECYMKSPYFSSMYSAVSFAFNYLISCNEKLAKDIEDAISRYQVAVNETDCSRPSDFLSLPTWYMQTVQKKEDDYLNPNGQFYKLRLDEAIDEFLLSKSLCP